MNEDKDAVFIHHSSLIIHHFLRAILAMNPRLKATLAVVALVASVALATHAHAQTSKRGAASKSGPTYTAAEAARDREIAARFAPVFYQGLGDKRRSDLITNFDFSASYLHAPSSTSSTRSGTTKAHSYRLHA